jgi:hypothetical protein
VNLADPVHGQVIGPMTLNRRAYIDVAFADPSEDGDGFDAAVFSDPELEFTLSG